MRWSLFSALLFAAIAHSAVAEDIPTETDQAKQWWRGHYQQAASEYKLHLKSHPDEPLSMNKKAILKYAHPKESTHGEIFVWTHDGRPQLIGSIWSYVPDGIRRSVVHEFQSFAREGLLPIEIGSGTWTPRTGIASEVIPDSPSPTKSSRLRSAQMRDLAKQFTGFSTPGGRKELELRMLPQPVFRFEAEQSDGAIFCFMNDWDPEIMLLIEARDSKWYFSVGRFNASPLRLQYKGVDVWKVKHTKYDNPRFGDPNGTFYAVHHVERFDEPKPSLSE